MTLEELERHAKTYSQTYKSGYGVWKDNFDVMARKTVLKLLLSKYAPKSIQMQQALTFDQAVVKNDLTTAETIDFLHRQRTAICQGQVGRDSRK